MAKGCDIGTCFLVSAAQDSNNQIQFKTIRDAFIDIENEPQIRNMLKLSKVDFIEAGEDKLYVIGDNAITMSNIFKKKARRPLSQGVLAPGESEAEKILMSLLESILGRARVQDEVCFYSVPGSSVNSPMDIIYHQNMFSKFLSVLGYKPVPLNEAAAIVYSEAAKENFSALAISMGAGMVNVALLYQTMIGMTFSIVNSGDWLDESAARATGSSEGKIQSIKEKGLNLLDPNDGDPKTLREREALIIYYKSLILRVLDSIKNEFQKHKTLDLPYAVPIILSGGTSLPKGFKQLFEEGFNSVKATFPIPISEIRCASSPLNSVAQGLLVAAMNYGQ